MISTTAGRLWLSQGLPAKYRDPAAKFDSKSVSALLDRVAREDPEDYPKVVKHLIDVGKTVAYRTGGYSFGLKSLRRPAAAIQVGDQIRTALASLYADPRTSQQEKRDAAIDAIAKAGEGYEKKVYDEALADKNPIALQVLSGSRGKPSTLQTLIGGDLLYQDSTGRPIPVPVTRSYSQGLTPAMYYSGAYGARTGVIGTKLMTANAGFLGKQFVGSSHRLVVGNLDHDEGKHGPDPNTHRGLPVDTADSGNVGSLLARDMGGYKRNTVLTGKILRDLKDQGLERILVRSPITSSSADGTIYGRDAGVRERGGIPAAGDQIGIAAAQAIGEIVSQSSLGSKHCLSVGTMVRMADGSTKPIEQIRVGDMVLGSDCWTRTRPVRVLNVFDNGPRPVAEYTFGHDIAVRCTADHKILYWRPGAEIAVPVRVEECGQTTATGVTGAAPVVPVGDGPWSAPLTSRSFTEEQQTYDIEVDHPDHLFVLANGLIVSNSGGVSKGVSQGPTGFKLLNLLAQAPKGSPFWAAHAGEDGAVKDIEPSPAGGWIVRVGSSAHHVPPTAELRVKPGDRVEAGDLLSSGIPDPNELVRHLGVGEARNRFMREFRKAVGAGSTERRNLELVSRGLINHVKMTDEHDDWLPDDVVPYDVVERSWRPREGATVRRPHEAVGHYLESPALHYSVGTKIRPSVVKELQHFGVDNVTTHDQPPPFQPHFVRAMENLQNDPDWMVQHMGSNLQKSTLKAVHRGATSDEDSTSFVPSLARGKDFGKTGPVKSYALGDVSKAL